jgi:outer membrane protein
VKNLPRAPKALFIGLFSAVVLFACNQNKSADNNQQTAKTEESKKDAVAELSIAYVNIDTLLRNYEFFKKVEKEMKGKQSVIETDLNGRASQLEREIATFQQNVNSGSITIQAAKEQEQQLMQKQQGLMQYRESIGRQYMEEEQKNTEKVFKNIREYVQKYAQDKGYTFILERGGAIVGSGILFADSTRDVTREILKGLNDEYKESSTK